MSDANRASSGFVLLGLFLSVGMIVGGWMLGSQIKATKLNDRYVTVRGLVERQVKSDLAIWPLSYKEAGDDLTAVYAKTEADKKSVLQFLSQQGIQPSEFELGVIQVIDTQAERVWCQPRAAPLHSRAAGHGANAARGPGRRRGTADHAASAERHRAEQQPRRGTYLQVHCTELHQTRHDHRSHAQRPRRGRPLRRRFRQQSRINSAGVSGRVFYHSSR